VIKAPTATTTGSAVQTVSNVAVFDTTKVNVVPTTASASTTTGALVVGGGVGIGGNVYAGGLISATGNITGNYILGNGALLTGVITSVANINSGNSNVTVVSSGGNVTVGVGGTSNVAVFAATGEYITGVLSASGNVTSGNILTAGLISAGGNITGGNLSVGTGAVTLGSIINANGKGVGNIGSTSNYFNTVFAKATSAQYADVAERYQADAFYDPGTVIVFGGDNEVTQSTQSHDPRIAGVVSTNPAYLMNSGDDRVNSTMVALLGRVPCRVVGTIRKGDLLTSSHIPGVAAKYNIDQYAPGVVVGKALENYSSESPGTIEVVIGRL
jgi:hypothetical protein